MVKFQCLDRRDLNAILIDVPILDNANKRDVEILKMIACQEMQMLKLPLG
jgi:hypothetical protein